MNLLWRPLGLNLRLQGGKPRSNSLSYGRASARINMGRISQVWRQHLQNSAHQFRHICPFGHIWNLENCWAILWNEIWFWGSLIKPLNSLSLIWRPTVSRLVCLGIKPPNGAQEQRIRCCGEKRNNTVVFYYLARLLICMVLGFLPQDATSTSSLITAQTEVLCRPRHAWWSPTK